MNISIKELKVSRSSDTHIRIAIKQDGCQYAEHDTFFCISKTEWHYVRACCLGFSDVYPYWDDGLYLLKFTPHYIRAVHTSGDKEDVWFTFPINELVQFIDYQFEYSGNDWRNDSEFQSENDFTSCIDGWKKEYGPNVIIDIEEEVKQQLATDIIHPMLKGPGYDLIERLVSWAGQYSNGNPISVHVTFDDLYRMKHCPNEPTSYYWWIMDDDQQVRIVNGGYIAHRYEQKDGTVQFEYAMHT